MNLVAVNSLKASKTSKTRDAETMIREYKQKRWVANSERIGKPDSLSGWYSLEEMENFIALAKSHGGDGIKFYYGVFPENYAPQPEYAGRQTFLMVATKAKLTEFGVVANKDMYVRGDGGTEILCNFFPPKGCPPDCNQVTDGGMGDLGITIVDKGKRGMEII